MVGYKFTEWCNVYKVNINSEEDTERGKYTHIKGCKKG